MVQSVTSSTSVAQTVNAKSKDVQTDTHSVIMRQIMALQSQLKDLYQTLAKTPPKDITQQLLLQRQIQGIEDEISALRSALIATENKKIMERQQADADKTQATKPAAVKPAEAASAPAPRATRTDPAQNAPAIAPPPASEPEEALYTSDGGSEPEAPAEAGSTIDELT